MDSTDLSIRSEERSTLDNVLIIGGSAILVAGLISFLGRKRRPFDDLPDSSTDPPPIIIKSGSFIIESDAKLVPDQANQPEYSRNNFGKIIGIRIITMDGNYDEYQQGVNWSASENVKIYLTIQSCLQEDAATGSCLRWGSDKQLVIANNGNHFRVTTPTIALSKNKNKHHVKRKWKIEDEENLSIQFSTIEIVKKSMAGQETTIASYSGDGRDYFIEFYNHFARP